MISRQQLYPSRGAMSESVLKRESPARKAGSRVKGQVDRDLSPFKTFETGLRSTFAGKSSAAGRLAAFADVLDLGLESLIADGSDHDLTAQHV